MEKYWKEQLGCEGSEPVAVVSSTGSWWGVDPGHAPALQAALDGRAALASQPAQAETVGVEGWKLVPKRVTPEMVDAACPAGEHVDHFDMARAIAAAIDAAPTPPQAQPAPVADHTALLNMIANRALHFPKYPLGYHIPEIFAAVDMEPPQLDGWPAPAPVAVDERLPIFEDWMRRQGMGHTLDRDTSGYVLPAVRWWKKVWDAALSARSGQDGGDAGGEVRNTKRYVCALISKHARVAIHTSRLVPRVSDANGIAAQWRKLYDPDVFGVAVLPVTFAAAPQPAAVSAEGLSSARFWVGAQNDAWFIVYGDKPAQSNDHPNHEADRTAVAKVYDEALARRLCELANAAAPAATVQDAGQAVGDKPAGCIKPDTATHVYFYEQDFYVLSNFSAFRVTFDGQTFDTSEAAYHYQRFTSADDRRGVLYANSAHEAFRYAQDHKARQRPDWDAVKVGVMRDILRAKAQQHEYVRRKLLATGDRVLVEDSWRDDFWGWGPNRDGHNMLGKLWMEVRAELRAALAANKEGQSHE